MSQVPAALYADVATLFDYNQLHHDLRPCSVGIGLGSHDLGVATFTAELFHRKMFPLIVFTGATTPTTAERFPRGEAVHYREQAIELGVPPETILVEPRATNTTQNIQFARELLHDHGLHPDSLLLISRPYQERRAYATCKLVWPEMEVICASQPLALPEYVASIGDAKLVIDMIVGDTQRVIEYPKLGQAAPQEVSPPVLEALDRLLGAGFTSRQI